MNYKEVTSRNNNIHTINNYEQIKSKERVNNHGEVLTPEWLVKDMVDLIPKAATKIDSRYLESSAGEGAFLVEVLSRKLNIIFSMYKDIEDREFYTIVAICNIYGIELLKDNVEVTRTRLEMLIKNFFINKNKITVSNLFFDIVRMILEINIINMDSMKFREPIFSENNNIMIDDNGGLIYKNELARISEWEFNYDKKEVKRIEYYYQDVVNKQREEYLLSIKEKQLAEINNDNNLLEDWNKVDETLERLDQISFFDYSSINQEIKLNERDKNIDRIELNPVRVFDSINYLKLLDLK